MPRVEVLEGVGLVTFTWLNQLRARGGREATLGVLSGRLRGGFTASPIPGSTRSPRLE